MGPTAIGPLPTLVILRDTTHEDGRVARWPQMARNLSRHFRDISRSAEMTPTICGARFTADERLKGGYVPDQGNPPVEPTPIPVDFVDTVRLCHGEIRDKGSARNQEKKRLVSRGGARSERWTLLT